MVEWKDKKNRSGDVESSEIRLGVFRLIVHRYVGYPPDMWLATCYGVFDKTEMKSKDIDEAKCQAKAKLQCLFLNAISDMVGVQEPNWNDKAEEGCLYPDKCCMGGIHYKSECHTAEDLEAMEEE